MVPLIVASLTRPLLAQDTPLGPVTVGAGVQASFLHTDTRGSDATDSFPLNSVRVYVNGPVTSKIKFMFNTEYEGVHNTLTVLDAAARFELSNRFNVWVGRFLPPSDRANLYGPYYAHHWLTFSDGVQDGYPMVAAGRSNGAMFWGQFGKVKLSAGGFDGMSATGSNTLIGAGRVQVDFWGPEDGYYLNGTYYGDKNLLALGAAGQVQGSDKRAYSVDVLLERKVRAAGAVTFEAEWARYDQLGGYSIGHGLNDGGYVLGSYLFPKLVGAGRFEVLAKSGKARFREGRTAADGNFDQTTTELNLNYVIKQFNSRLMIFFQDTRFTAVRPDSKRVGVGVQLQM